MTVQGALTTGRGPTKEFFFIFLSFIEFSKQNFIHSGSNNIARFENLIKLPKL